ncbi:hypothetical protein U8527_09830 [Kordia algicida OT-1]|uniref:Uncharacterized protein n=1 Tax=Kordia algicida OT-1 TaxID=391587 RepID=A9DVB7_9FLAO|nr:hypothetical protein [Kordia algicida]EDP96400.1 hypothetical protein KAOT1_03287 [Kordia algicida OT-1]
MKKLELNQLLKFEGGSDCVDEGNGFMVGAVVAGAMAGPAGFAIGAFVGLLGGTFISLTGACNIEIF